MRLTDMADELYAAAADLPGGVRTATARRGGVTVTRVEIAREGLEKPRGRYVTLEVPSVSVLDERDAEVIEQAAEELLASWLREQTAQWQLPDQETELISYEHFHTVHGYYETGDIYSLRMQLKPGILYKVSGREVSF